MEIEASSRETQIAVLLRAAQWSLDDAAYKIGVQRVRDVQVEHLVFGLEELAAVLRNEYFPAAHTVDDEVAAP